MAKVQGVKEKLHFPLYDAFFVKDGSGRTHQKSSQSVMTDPRVIRFFVDVQNKTKLETNLQAAGVTAQPEYLRGAGFARGGVQSAIPTEFIEKQGSAPKGSANESEILADLIYNSVTSSHRGRKDHDRDAHLVVSIWRWCKSGIHHLTITASLTRRRHSASPSRASSSHSRTSEWRCCSLGTCPE